MAITAALDDLTTAATVVEVLGVGEGDIKLPRLIRAASGAVRQYLNRKQLHYVPAYVEKVRPALGRPRLVLDLTPVVSVASVVLEDGSTVDPSDYLVEDADIGFLYRAVGWPYSGLVQGGMLYRDPAAGTSKPSITVTYAGGWVTPAQVASAGWSALLPRTLPEDLEEAVVQTVVALYRRGGMDQSISAESMGAYSVSYRNPNSLIGLGQGGIIPDQAAATLDPYRRPLA